jgi:hypothetical protein
MAEYDVLIRNGTIVDGTRVPAYRGDIGIRAGRIAAMGRIKGGAKRVIDATGLIVAPGFIDLHTHYDAALSGGTNWDPYATISGWHGVTTVLIGNCGFGFAPVHPEDRERAMLRMERTESIPLSCMQAGMRWDWVTFPEYLDSLERGKIGVNAASMLPYSPLRAWVMGNEEARDPKYKANSEQVAEMKHLLREGLEAGAFGFSATFSPANRDYDGGYLPTHVAPREEFLEMASVLADYNRGSIEWTIGKHLERLGMDFLDQRAAGQFQRRRPQPPGSRWMAQDAGVDRKGLPRSDRPPGQHLRAAGLRIYPRHHRAVRSVAIVEGSHDGQPGGAQDQTGRPGAARGPETRHGGAPAASARRELRRRSRTGLDVSLGYHLCC